MGKITDLELLACQEEILELKLQLGDRDKVIRTLRDCKIWLEDENEDLIKERDMYKKMALEA